MVDRSKIISVYEGDIKFNANLGTRHGPLKEPRVKHRQTRNVEAFSML